MSRLDRGHQRTPIVRVELQLWPQPPKDARPYFCLVDTLIFYDDDMNQIWRQRLPFLSGLHPDHPRSIDLDHDDHFGWIITLTYTHDDARDLLAPLDIQIPPGEHRDTTRCPRCHEPATVHESCPDCRLAMCPDCLRAHTHGPGVTDTCTLRDDVTPSLRESGVIRR